MQIRKPAPTATATVRIGQSSIIANSHLHGGALDAEMKRQLRQLRKEPCRYNTYRAPMVN
jgi:hypothetical protein